MNRRRLFRELQHELVEGRPRVWNPASRNPGERRLGVLGPGMILQRQLPHPLLAQRRHEQGRSQHAQPFVGTDVRGRALAADVLLTGGQRQHIADPPLGVLGLAHQPTG